MIRPENPRGGSTFSLANPVPGTPGFRLAASRTGFREPDPSHREIIGPGGHVPRRDRHLNRPSRGAHSTAKRPGDRGTRLIAISD